MGEELRRDTESGMAYFAASNSEKGFHSYYEECFGGKEIESLWVIKGGPGTGKSRLMADVLAAGRSCGWQGERIYCSSDPSSLDGIILKKDGRCMAMLDGTSPHLWEPRMAGVREHLINLGELWDVERLGERRGEIEALGLEKSEAYGRCYRYLAAYGEVERNRRELMEPAWRLQALERYAKRLMRPLGQGEKFESRTMLIGAIGMRGSVRLDSFYAAADQLFLVEDRHGSGGMLMDTLYRLAAEQRLRVWVSKDPILLERVDGLFFPDHGICFALDTEHTCSYPHRMLSTARFIDRSTMKRIRGDVGYAERMKRGLLIGALEQMDRVRLAHFALEEIYSAAMDFSAKEIFTKKLCCRLFDLQNRSECGKIGEDRR